MPEPKKNDTQAKDSKENPEASPVDWEKRYNDQQEFLRKSREELKAYKEQTMPEMEGKLKKAVSDNMEWNKFFKREHEPYRNLIIQAMEAERDGRPLQSQNRTAAKDTDSDWLGDLGEGGHDSEVLAHIDRLSKKNKELEDNLVKMAHAVEAKATGINSALDFVNELGRLRTQRMKAGDDDFDEGKIVQEALKTGNLNVKSLYNQFYGARDEERRIDERAQQKFNELKESEAAAKLKTELSNTQGVDNTLPIPDRIKSAIEAASKEGPAVIGAWSPVERSKRWNEAIAGVKQKSLADDGIEHFKGN